LTVKATDAPLGGIGRQYVLESDDRIVGRARGRQPERQTGGGERTQDATAFSQAGDTIDGNCGHSRPPTGIDYGLEGIGGVTASSSDEGSLQAHVYPVGGSSRCLGDTTFGDVDVESVHEDPSGLGVLDSVEKPPQDPEAGGGYAPDDS